MPVSEPAAVAGHKRKRDSTKSDRKASKVKSRRKSQSPEEAGEQETILQLEAQITESRRHFNNIVLLIQKARDNNVEEEVAIFAAVALCRVFTRLLTSGDMGKTKGLPEPEVVIVLWLKERYNEFCQLLLNGYLRSDSGAKQSTALALIMRLVKTEAAADKDYNWKRGLLSQTVDCLILLPPGNFAMQEFAEKYFNKFDDVRYHTFQTISSLNEFEQTDDIRNLFKSSSLALFLALDRIPTLNEELDSFWAERPIKKSSPLLSLAAHKSAAQSAWMVVLRIGLTKEESKKVLTVFTHRIAPWFQRPEMLMDFLTDSYNLGGSTSLLALSGLYYLMSEKNLDYPSFFPKLYSLLDDTILHSKHRSRFFRLLDTFMASTHLPAALVASFIKRLARLALHGPPAGIVVVVPWIYNMFKRHPACTFMIHRETRNPEVRKEMEEEGTEDPFDMEEEDPMLTDAIESSLWEIETLQSHYHPNVATLAKIISEQFTKRSYNLEDFLDQSYTALLDIELGKGLKKAPVVEYEIPKRILSADNGELGNLGQLLGKVIEMS